MHNPQNLPNDLPIPQDDGLTRHLQGALLPAIELQSSDGGSVKLSQLTEPTVIFTYPRTGIAGQPPSLGFDGQTWESIPGARGCTPQSCGFRDLYSQFSTLGVKVFGLSTQDSAFQADFKARNHVPFEFLSDVDLHLTRALTLPTFEFPVLSGGPPTLLRRMAWFVHQGRIEQIWYPVFPPNENAQNVLNWLQDQLPWFVGREQAGVVVARERNVDARELAQVFDSSGINRPCSDLPRLERMLANANLVVSARHGGRLVGVARCLWDRGWCCYVSDLAVDRRLQGGGVGKRLLAAVSAICGPETSVILLAAPTAESYYPHVGFDHVPSAWQIKRTSRI